MASDASSSTVQKPPCSKVLASKHRKEITQGQGWVGSGKNIVFKTFTPAEIEFKRKRIDAYDGWMEANGTTFRAGVGKWAKQLHTATSATKKDTTAIKKTVEDIEVRTMATHEEVLKLRKDVADYKEKVQTHTQPSLSKLQIVAMMAGPSTPVRFLKSILDSEGLECQGNKQDKAVFLGERFAEHKLLELIAAPIYCIVTMQRRSQDKTTKLSIRMEMRKSLDAMTGLARRPPRKLLTSTSTITLRRMWRP